MSKIIWEISLLAGRYGMRHGDMSRCMNRYSIWYGGEEEEADM